MALPSTVYKAAIQFSDIDRGIYETLQTTVAQHPSETAERLVTRLLAYLIFHEEGLTFTKGIGAADEPDLWLKGPDGRVRLWVEVGLPESDRIIKASRHSEKAVILACGKTLPNWEMQQLPKLNKLSNLTVKSLDHSFINDLASRLERFITWSVTITEGTLYLSMANGTLQTPILTKYGNY
ncbi:MAG: hypothetical protein A2X80_00060 [Geobacteraceae bacterium GWB2_52_12]|nr:MAG: hypothetical protein A2X80_00060 [Geobacteraceae bacterium GWB2_52_12]